MLMKCMPMAEALTLTEDASVCRPGRRGAVDDRHLPLVVPLAGDGNTRRSPPELSSASGMPPSLDLGLITRTVTQIASAPHSPGSGGKSLRQLALTCPGVHSRAVAVPLTPMMDAQQRRTDTAPALALGSRFDAVTPSARSRSSVDASSQWRRHDQSRTGSRTRSGPTLSSARFCVFVGPTAFRVCWLTILLFHTACMLFCVGAATVYSAVPGTMLAYLISSKALAIGMKHFPLVANVYSAIAAGHALFIASMLLASVADSQLAFFWWPTRGRRPLRFRNISSISPTIVSVIEPAVRAGEKMDSTVRSGPTLPNAKLARVPSMTAILTMAQPQVVRVSTTFDALFGRTGLFGVNGRHFEHIMLLRELCEASLQGLQAYELARLLPRLGVVRAYVAMLIVNCWSTLILHRLVPFNLPLQRMLCLVCDLLLDFASVIGVWTVVVYRYTGQYDPVLASFPIKYLTDEIWYVNFVNEFRLVLISSWFDLGSQVVFFISIFSAINDVKLLLRRRSNAPVDAAAASAARAKRRNSVDPHHAIRNSTDAFASRQLSAKLRAIAQVKRYSSSLTRLLELIIALLGGAILVIHAFAETRPSVQGCRLEVLTWLRSQSGCALLEIDCYCANATGSQLEITTALNRVAVSSLEQVTFAHCPSLHMPLKIQELHQLRALKLYNSTIVKWDADTALTKTCHPMLGVFAAVRVNMTDQRLPAGLMSPEFPPLLTSFQLSAVDLAELPAELASIWPHQFSLLWESSGLTAVPQNLVKMPIAYLSLADNAIADLPPEFAYMPALTVVNLGGNPLSELAPGGNKNAVPMGEAVVLQITSTEIETLPSSLIDTLATSSGRVVFAGSTPMCQALEDGRAGIDKRLVALHSSGTINCAGGGNSRSFPLDATTAQYEIRAGRCNK